MSVNIQLTEGEWTVFDYDIPVSVQSGDTVGLRGASSDEGYQYAVRPVFSFNYKAEGNLISLFTANLPSSTDSSSIGRYSYSYLFSGDTHLIDAENVHFPWTSISGPAFDGMFQDCTNMIKAPSILPATNLAMFNEYRNMFKGCSKITTAPVLPAETIGQGSYYGMFSGCTSLTGITCLATDISTDGCTTNWVAGVASSGTFTKAAGMSSWTTGVNGIPSNWTVQDAS